MPGPLSLHRAGACRIDIALLAVARDGRTVTVVEWGRLGDLDGAPLAGIKQTARTAVAKLH
ncbi:hypothetical protein ACWGI0_29805 [Streptomyces sp. NPDC054802]